MNVENSNVSMAKYFSVGPSEPGGMGGPSPLEILADTLIGDGEIITAIAPQP